MHVQLYMCDLLFNFYTADTENNLSEDDGWEFVTLADQVICHVTSHVTLGTNL